MGVTLYSRTDSSVAVIILSSHGEFPESVSRSLACAENTVITADGWAADIHKVRAAEKDAVLEMAPSLRC